MTVAYIYRRFGISLLSEMWTMIKHDSAEHGSEGGGYNYASAMLLIPVRNIINKQRIRNRKLTYLKLVASVLAATNVRNSHDIFIYCIHKCTFLIYQMLNKRDRAFIQLMGTIVKEDMQIPVSYMNSKLVIIAKIAGCYTYYNSYFI